MVLAVLMLLFATTIMSACTKKGESKGFLDEVSGVWRATKDGAMVSIIYADNKMRMFINDDPIPVTLGDIDNSNKTVNLNVTTNLGKPGVWTIRQVWDKEHKSFHLQLTLHDGMQDDLTFIRKISSDDMNKFANLDAKQAGSIGAAAKADSYNEPAPAKAEAPNAAPQPQADQQITWAPSFDCAKVSNGPERLICSNKELSEADVKLAQVYKAALKSASDKNALKQAQSAWLKNDRNACADVDCMLRVYNERISALSK